MFHSGSGVFELVNGGVKALLVPIRRSQMRVAVLDIIVLSDKSVSSMETE